MSPGGGMTTVSCAAKAAAPYTRRSGWAKLEAVYCVAGDGAGKPQSQAGPRRGPRPAQPGNTNSGAGGAEAPEKGNARGTETPRAAPKADDEDRVGPRPGPRSAPP